MASELSAVLARVLPTIGPKTCLAGGGRAPAVVVYVHRCLREFNLPSPANNLRHALKPPGNGLKCVVIRKLGNGRWSPWHPHRRSSHNPGPRANRAPAEVELIHSIEAARKVGWTSHTRPSGQ